MACSGTAFNIQHSQPFPFSLSPWRQNPKVHDRIHKNPPLVPVLSQLNPLQTPPASHPKIHSDPILPSMTRSSEWSPSFGLSHQDPVRFSLLSYACHMPSPPRFPCLDFPSLGMSTNYEVPHRATSSILLLRPSGVVQCVYGCCDGGTWYFWQLSF
jgi:hypothetical protein